MAAKSAASAAIAKLKKQAGTKWKDAKKAEPGGGQFAGVPGGNYVFQASSAKVDLDKNKNPFVLINLVIPEGPYKGKRGSKFYGFKATEKRTLEDCLAAVVKDLKCLGFEESDLEIDDLPAVCEAIIADKPYFHGKLVEGKDGFDANVWFNAPYEGEEEEELEEEEAEPKSGGRGRKGGKKATAEEEDNSDEEVSSEEEEETEEEEEETEEEEEETEEESEDEDFIPEVNTDYMVTLPGSRKAVKCKVKSVNQSKGTCIVINKKGEKATVAFHAIGDEA